MDKEKKQLVVFGYGVAVILGLISVHVWRHHGWHPAHTLLLPGVIVFIVLTVANGALLKPLYKRWMAVAHFIGAVITGVILSFLFYLVFGIAGMILRLMRKDLLDRKIDRAAGSYWIDKDQVVFEAEHYKRQF